MTDAGPETRVRVSCVSCGMARRFGGDGGRDARMSDAVMQEAEVTVIADREEEKKSVILLQPSLRRFVDDDDVMMM